MAKIIFGAHPGLGLILLPVLLYHPLQLIVWCSADPLGVDRSPIRDCHEFLYVGTSNLT